MKGFSLACALCVLALSAGAVSDFESLPKNCEEIVFKNDTDVYQNGYTCFYANKTLLQRYVEFRNDTITEGSTAEYLRESLEPLKNHDDHIDYYLDISYRWKGKNTLMVTMSLVNSIGGVGVTTVEFIENENGVKETIINSFKD
jgi:hypothetical protein